MSNNLKIAISGKSGCGNSTVSRMTAERLGLTVINYTFRNMAEERGVTFSALREMAEQDDTLDRELDRKQVERAKEGNCVLGSRLAVWMLKDADLKVFLTASLAVRAERIAKREKRDFKEVLQETEERDKLDHDRYLRIYGIDNDDLSSVDLIIDTDVNNQQETTDLIVKAVESLQKNR